MARTLEEAAQKGTANAALGLAIGALGLEFLGGGMGRKGLNLFGGNCGCEETSCGRTAPTAWEVSQKECADTLALQAGIYEMVIKGQQARFEDRTYVDHNFYQVGQAIARTNARIDIIEAKMPLEAKIVSMEIAEAKNQTRCELAWRTRNMISGEVVLPTTPTVTGIPSYNPCCRTTPAPTPAE